VKKGGDRGKYIIYIGVGGAYILVESAGWEEVRQRGGLGPGEAVFIYIWTEENIVKHPKNND